MSNDLVLCEVRLVKPGDRFYEEDLTGWYVIDNPPRMAEAALKKLTKPDASPDAAVTQTSEGQQWASEAGYVMVRTGLTTEDGPLSQIAQDPSYSGTLSDFLMKDFQEIARIGCRIMDDKTKERLEKVWATNDPPKPVTSVSYFGHFSVEPYQLDPGGACLYGIQFNGALNVDSKNLESVLSYKAYATQA